MYVDPTGCFYVSLKSMIKVLAVIGINPIEAVVIGIGVYKLRKCLLAQWGFLMIRIGSLEPVGLVAETAAISFPSIPSFAQAIIDCFVQVKKGIDFRLKRF
jgi:hypothetical protein